MGGGGGGGRCENDYSSREQEVRWKRFLFMSFPLKPSHQNFHRFEFSFLWRKKRRERRRRGRRRREREREEEERERQRERERRRRRREREEEEEEERERGEEEEDARSFIHDVVPGLKLRLTTPAHAALTFSSAWRPQEPC